MFTLNGRAATIEHFGVYKKSENSKMQCNNKAIEYDNLSIKSLNGTITTRIRANYFPKEIDHQNRAVNLNDVDRTKIDITYWRESVDAKVHQLNGSGCCIALSKETGDIAIGLESGGDYY